MAWASAGSIFCTFNTILFKVAQEFITSASTEKSITRNHTYIASILKLMKFNQILTFFHGEKSLLAFVIELLLLSF